MGGSGRGGESDRQPVTRADRGQVFYNNGNKGTPGTIREDIKAKNTLQFGHCPNYPPTPQFGQLYRLFPADKNDVLRVWQKKILMMIIIVAMIILIKILVILMIMMTKITEKPTNIVNFG